MICFPYVSGVSIYDGTILETIRQQVTDEKAMKLQDHAQEFFKEYKLHGEDDSYREHLCRLKANISWGIKALESLIEDVRYTVCNKKLIQVQIKEYKSKLSKIHVGYRLVKDINIYDDKIPESIRQRAADAVAAELQDLVQSFLEEFKLHGKEDLYLDYFSDFKRKIDLKIEFIESFINNDDYKLSNKKLITDKLVEYKSKLRNVSMEISKRRQETDTNDGIPVAEILWHNRIPLRVVQ